MSQFQQPDNLTPQTFGPNFFQTMAAGGAADQAQQQGGRGGGGYNVGGVSHDNQMAELSRILNRRFYGGNANAGWPETRATAQERIQKINGGMGDQLGLPNVLPNSQPGYTNAIQTTVHADQSERLAQQKIIESFKYHIARGRGSVQELVAEPFIPEIISSLMNGLEFRDQESLSALLMSDTIAEQLSLRHLDELDQSLLGSQVPGLGTRGENLWSKLRQNMTGDYPDAHVQGSNGWEEWQQVIQAVQQEGKTHWDDVSDWVSVTPGLNWMFGMQEGEVATEGSFGKGGIITNELIGTTQFLNMAQAVKGESEGIATNIASELGWSSDRSKKVGEIVAQLQQFNYDIYATNSDTVGGIREAIKRAGQRDPSGGSLAEQKMVDYYTDLLGIGAGRLSARGSGGREAERLRMNSESYQENWQNYQNYIDDILAANPEEGQLALQISGQLNEHLGGLKNKYANKQGNAQAIAAYQESLMAMDGADPSEVARHVAALKSQYGGVARAADRYGQTHSELGVKYHVSAKEYGSLVDSMTGVLDFYGDQTAYDNPEDAIAHIGAIRDRLMDPSKGTDFLDTMAELGYDLNTPEAQELLSMIAPEASTVQAFYDTTTSRIQDSIENDGKLPVLADPNTPWEKAIQVMVLENVMSQTQEDWAMQDELDLAGLAGGGMGSGQSPLDLFSPPNPNTDFYGNPISDEPVYYMDGGE